MTRDIDWGIPIPLDGWRDQPKRLYVWFDAVIGYLSASIEWARRPGGTGALAGVVERRPASREPGRCPTTSWARTTSSSTARSGRPSCWRTTDAGDRGGSPGEYGTLELPTEVVSSEFLTMESRQFSTSRGHVILVGDMLARYQPDALRYFISAAGPETSDADFTWAEFVQRTNSELVAGWGNLVNRHRHDDRQELRRGPARAVTSEPSTRRSSTSSPSAFDTVGDLIGRHRHRAAIAEAMRAVGEVNKYLTVTEPYKMKDESQRDRLAHRPARRGAVRARLQHPARAVPAALLQQGVAGARR